MTMKLKKERLVKLNNNSQNSYYKKRSAGINIIKNRDNDSDNSLIFGLDVRGKRAEEALQIVVRFIDDAVVNQKSEVKILHGTGTGILKQFIRDYLRTQSVVKSYKNERIEKGGAGITVVSLC